MVETPEAEAGTLSRRSKSSRPFESLTEVRQFFRRVKSREFPF